jgi:flagellar motor switch protein FliN/FliY
MSVDTRDIAPAAETERPSDSGAGATVPDEALSPASRANPPGMTAGAPGGAPDGRSSVSASSAPYFHTPDFLLDVRLTVSVEVGRVQLPVRQIMEMGPGSVIELQRSASEPVEVFANGRCIGKGEIVVVGEYFGVRLTELGPVN